MDVSKLTGSAKGYVGYDDEPALIKAVREKPNSVVLFDEVEKAHKSVWKILLNILDEGEMTDNKGNKISFRNCIIIFTTNLGCTHNTGKSTGMGFVKMTNEHDTKDIMKAIENYFSPEFLGRLDDIVMYNALSKDIARLLVGRYIDYFKEVSESEVEFTDEDIETVIKESEIETRGARGLKRAVRKQYVRIEDRLEELGD